MTPQPTEQYGQVLRVSLAWASLKSRTSATARSAEKPSAPTVVAPIPDAVILRNPLRETCIDDLRDWLGYQVGAEEGSASLVAPAKGREGIRTSPALARCV